MGRFQRVAEAFEVAAKARDCDSSGSEHSMMDLSDLVNSFIENTDDCASDFDSESNSNGIDEDMEQMKESLKRLFGYENGDEVRRNLIREVGRAWQGQGVGVAPSSSAFKRQLMVRLRDRGLDAGVCKSKWEKKGGLVSGDHEYVDVNIDGSRYIIVVSVVEEFRIARPTQGYDWVLQMLPQISVCKMDELKEMVRIMCRAIKKSMKQMKMPVPPWRRLHYSQAKWFGPYKRTTNQFSTKNSFQQHSVTKDVGFKIGNLTMEPAS